MARRSRRTQPLGLAILESRGRTSGKLRRVPVGNGRKGDSIWIIAKHGVRANYWVTGVATVLPRSKGRPGPNLEHMILHCLILVGLVLAVVTATPA